MRQTKKIAFILVALLVAATAFLVSCQAETDGNKIGTINVLGVWGGDELASFQAMVEPWEQQTGGAMGFSGTRDLIAILTTRIQGGNPPDVAILPNPGQMVELANDGDLVALDSFLDMNTIRQQYAQGWLDLGTVNGKLYGIFMKADSKSTVWYDPKVFQANGWTAPEALNQLFSGCF